MRYRLNCDADSFTVAYCKRRSANVNKAIEAMIITLLKSLELAIELNTEKKKIDNNNF